MKQTTGEFLATMRKAGGFTQQEVADKLGVSNRTLSSWETDRTAPDILILPAIADLYGVTVDEILRGERRAAVNRGEEISDGAKRNLRKSRFAKYGVRRLICLGLGLFGGAVFVAACAIMLYSSAPLWLSVLLMALGAGGCVACVILLACFTYSALRGEGIVLKEDYNDGNKPYVLTLRHNTANALKWLSLPYITGAIIFLIVFFAAGYSDFSISMGGVTVEVDYTTPTVVCVCLNAVFALALFIAGFAYERTGIKNLGGEGHKSAIKFNRKLLGKICGFSAIPVAVALILMITFFSVFPCRTKYLYFKADGVDGVYKEFQTFKTDGFDEVDAGEYFLDFQSEKTVTLLTDTGAEDFVDLGNGFYGLHRYYYAGGTPWPLDWLVYYRIEGKDISQAEQHEPYYDYLTFVQGGYEDVSFYTSDGEVLYAVNVNYWWASEMAGSWEEGALTLYKRCRNVVLNEKTGVYRYEEYRYYDYSKVFTVVFFTVIGATVIAGVIAYLIKRKKAEYSF